MQRDMRYTWILFMVVLAGAVASGLFYAQKKTQNSQIELNQKLIEAVRSGDLETVQRSLLSGANPNIAVKIQMGGVEIETTLDNMALESISTVGKIPEVLPKDRSGVEVQKEFHTNGITQSTFKEIHSILLAYQDKLNQPLIQAVQSGDLEGVRKALDSGANPNVTVHIESDNSKSIVPLDDIASSELLYFETPKGVIPKFSSLKKKREEYFSKGINQKTLMEIRDLLRSTIKLNRQAKSPANGFNEYRDTKGVLRQECCFGEMEKLPEGLLCENVILQVLSLDSVKPDSVRSLVVKADLALLQMKDDSISLQSISRAELQGNIIVEFLPERIDIVKGMISQATENSVRRIKGDMGFMDLELYLLQIDDTEMYLDENCQIIRERTGG